MSYTYIIYSNHLKKNYIGACAGSLDDRIRAHNDGIYGSHRFTATVGDWELKLALECDDYSHAIRLERKIKKMKSSKYIDNLLRYKEMRDKILDETRNI